MEHRFEHEHSQELTGRSRQEQGSRKDFEKAEDLLRADRARVEPPDSLPDRLAASGASEGLTGRGRRPWWRRLFGG